MGSIWAAFIGKMLQSFPLRLDFSQIVQEDTRKGACGPPPHAKRSQNFERVLAIRLAVVVVGCSCSFYRDTISTENSYYSCQTFSYVNNHLAWRSDALNLCSCLLCLAPSRCHLPNGAGEYNFEMRLVKPLKETVRLQTSVHTRKRSIDYC